MGSAAKQIAGKMEWLKVPHLATGSHPSFIAKKYCRNEAK